MLSEIMLAGVKTAKDPNDTRLPEIYISSLYPCPYRLYLAHTNKLWADEPTPQQVLNMSDGNMQESQAVERLGTAGVTVEDRQKSVSIGKSKVRGRLDGTITLDSKKSIWEFKAMNGDRYSELTRWGLRTFLNYKSQINGYMVGENLDSCWFMAKHKDSNSYYDMKIKLDEAFITPIIDACDKIRLDEWIPEPVKSPYCSNCGIGCFGALADFSWIGRVDEHEMVKKWRDGKTYKVIGESMMDEARAAFCGVQDKFGNVIVPGLIGDKEELWVEELKIQQVTQHRFDINKQKILEEFGPRGLMKVGDEREVKFYRITDKGV